MQMKNCEPLVFGAAVRHRDRTLDVLLVHRLVRELEPGAAASARAGRRRGRGRHVADALRIAALDDELRHDAVERDAVVVIDCASTSP